MKLFAFKPSFLRLAAFSLAERPPRTYRAISVPVANFSSYNPVSTSGSGQCTSRRPQHDEVSLSRGVKVSVWWDFENCNLPTGANVFKVAQTITAAVRINGIKGPITITAFGDLLQLSRTNQEALSATGVSLTHVPQGGKNSTDRFLITDLMCWVTRNPPPAHLFLISSDRDYAGVLHRLRMSNYNILLAGYEEKTARVLCSAASIMWDWNALVKGKNSIGKHFNQPPDGPYNSWYGHYRTPLLDPFATSSSTTTTTTKQQPCTSVKTAELQESNSNTISCSSKVCPRIPEEVVKQIALVLSLYPKGAAITKLREQLSKRNVPLGKDFYGHKKFSTFLLSLPEILQVVPKGDGVFLVQACAHEMDKKASSPKLSSENPEVVSVETAELQESDSNTISCSSKVCPPIPEEVVKQIRLVLSLYPKGVVITELRAQLSERNVPLGKDFYGHKKFSTFLLSLPEILQVVPKGEGVFLVQACAHEMDKKASSPKLSSEVKKHQKVKQNVKDLKKESVTQETSQESVPVTSEMEVKAKGKSLKENQLALTAGDDVSSSSKEKDGFLNKLNRQWFGSPEMGLEHLQEKKRICGNGDEGKGVVNEGKVEDTVLETQTASSTSIESAKEVKADTEVGDEKSKSPGLLSGVLKRFNFFGRKITELCKAAATGTQVDDIFAKDSFWKDVDSFINSPRGFVVVSHSKSREALAKNLKDEGPSSLKPLDVSKMLDLISQLISDKKWIKENPSDALPFRVTRFTEKSSCLSNPRASSALRSIVVNMSKSQCDEGDDEKKSENNSVSERPLERSRSEVIADCHKLIKKITEEHPGGYNMSYFKKEFLETFGYRLDYRNLGYPKLQSLIQTMPEARIEAGYIVPSSTPAPCESDSLSEEHGSVSKKSHDHEPYDETSDAGTDKGAPLKQSGDERKKKKADEIERVLQVLGSWDTVEDFGKEKLVDGILTSLREKPSDESRV